ncbi:hypothetical protein M426DRAFT_72762 [Hypoxylon sp. CI-4A]|nr:hypothetical protein M426DRAFT_72762 [Hypoxylon sp. CI-4A]
MDAFLYNINFYSSLWICRDGFQFAYDRFLALPGQVDRVETSALDDMFLPKLTPAATRALRNNFHFVEGQLKHYGVEYNDDELTGNGTNLLKKMLMAGKLDKVPDKIEKLKAELSEEWHNQLTIEELVDINPGWLLKKYFLGLSGNPDRSKTTDVLVLPLPPRSTYRAGKVIGLLKDVKDLHHDRKGDALYVCWDPVKLRDAAEGHFERLQQQQQKEQEARDQERQAAHSDYLRRTQSSNGEGSCSPVGSYIVDCTAIEENWPGEAENMTLEIHATDEQGVFEAQYDFGMIEGMMILCASKSTLDEYCDQLDREDAPSDDELSEDDSQSEEDRRILSSKRPAERNRGRLPKKAKEQNDDESKTFFVQLKARENGEGEISPIADKGTLKFKDFRFASFAAKVDINFVSRDVSFSALKVSDTPQYGRDSWSAYSEVAHERACRARWGKWVG